MSIFQSTNPLDWSALDGVYIDDVAPPPNVVGVAVNVAIIVGQFERGAPGIQSVGSVKALYQLYGTNLAFTGLADLQNKQFGSLKVVRVVAASGAANGVLACASSTVTRITFTALWTGAYGNLITVKIQAGSTSGSKYTIHDGNPGAVWPDEVYDNVVISAVGATFAASNLVTATVNSSALEPATQAATALASGSDGSIADGDYQTAIINQCQSAGVGNVLWTDKYDTAIKGYLLASMAATTDKMCILAGAAGDSVATAVTDVASYRDTQGRLIYGWPYVYTAINGVNTVVSPAGFYASLLSQIAPNIDPAESQNAQYLSGIASLDLASQPQRSDYISLLNAGICALEVDSYFGIKIKSGVVTQIANSSLIMIFRRRMADYIIQSLAIFMDNYQNGVNSLKNRDNAKVAITTFNTKLESTGLVPTDAEVSSGNASIIDTTSLNDDAAIAAGFFYIIYKRRIYSSMRFIVLQTQIGTSVVVTEANG
jgi:hypothetical protein